MFVFTRLLLLGCFVCVRACASLQARLLIPITVCHRRGGVRFRSVVDLYFGVFSPRGGVVIPTGELSPRGSCPEEKVISRKTFSRGETCFQKKMFQGKKYFRGSCPEGKVVLRNLSREGYSQKNVPRGNLSPEKSYSKENIFQRK